MSRPQSYWGILGLLLLSFQKSSCCFSASASLPSKPSLDSIQAEQGRHPPKGSLRRRCGSIEYTAICLLTMRRFGGMILFRVATSVLRFRENVHLASAAHGDLVTVTFARGAFVQRNGSMLLALQPCPVIRMHYFANVFYAGSAR